MVTRVDLRVHTTASSSKKDDERFKAQAKAYGTFTVAPTRAIRQSHSSLSANHGLHSPSYVGHVSSVTRNDMRYVADQGLDDASEKPYDPTTFLEETQLGYTALESQLFIPSSRNKELRPASSHVTKRNGPTLQFEKVLPSQDDQNVDESTSSPQVPSQSSYLHSPVLDRSTKKPKLSEENRRFFQTTESLLPPFTALQEDVGPTAGGISREEEVSCTGARNENHSLISGSNSMPVDDVTSELPSSYSLSDGTSGSSKSKHQSIQRPVSNPGPLDVKPLDNKHEGNERPSNCSSSSQSGHQIEQTKPLRKPSLTSQVPPSIDRTVVKDFANREIGHVDTSNSPLGYPDLPTSLRAPPPQPSLKPFETHINEALRYLGDNKGLMECYKPVSVSRELRQSERGSWKFNITPWPAQLRVDFFEFLTRMIEGGRVGWGIWCVRESLSLDVQVFCWGEMVRHVYLMLYVASKSKVRKLGLKWVDSEGHVVVQMRGVSEVNDLSKIS
ncbi:hypothetical protein Q7P37_009281 [Cladosporium fusiforme]